ncbi:MAG: bifunctional aldolase/short-chain dehydrogenase [Planctomycetota bacterium]|nr:MAG: bifunctional aldolase/short-chain dehydrogenase [Planctomycetota bacterium]
MQSRWNDENAARWIADLADECNEDLALRVYSSRLIGQDADLVLHGGGNTSVKTKIRDQVGDERTVLCVKGSGWDLASIQAPGLPAVDLAALRRFEKLESLSDEDMVRGLRANLLDPGAPTPSVEALLHAFLPDRFVDHTHADAALIFGNRPEGADELRQLFGDRVGVLEWIMPGFPLAKRVAEYRRQNPEAIGLVLHQHGVFSWGEDARTSYERMIEIVDALEQAIAARLAGSCPMLDLKLRPSEADLRETALKVLPILRRCLSVSTGDDLVPERPMLCDWRPTEDALAFASHPDAAALAGTSPLTPDHVIRTKAAYVVAQANEESIAAAVARFASEYQSYFDACRGRRELSMLDPFPRVALIEGAGLFAFGASKKAARIAGDIAEHTISGKARSAALSSYEALSPGELFEMEYWSLEQAKLGKAKEAPLARRVAVVNGAAGAIGFAVARALLERGAHLVISDLPGAALEHAQQELAAIDASRVVAMPADVTDEGQVRMLFETALLTFGGIDIVVLNAGIAHVQALADMDLGRWQRVQDVNATGTLLCLREASRLLQEQKLGGRIVVNASKNVPSPGAEFGAYSASKASAAQLAKVAALELAPHGVMVNLVHADGVFEDEGSGTASGLWAEVGPQRMRVRGLSESELREYYKSRNMLSVSVRARHVAEAVLFFAEARTPTTGAALTVDGGHLATFYR